MDSRAPPHGPRSHTPPLRKGSPHASVAYPMGLNWQIARRSTSPNAGSMVGYWILSPPLRGALLEALLLDRMPST
ncbi:hypothetical protein ACQJBY_032746 [Aegilops geniculata]